MSFKKSEMLYDNGYYKWSARANDDNPNFRRGADYALLNKTEGYEVLDFLNRLGEKRWNNPNTATYQKMERILRYHVPGRSTHKDAGDFIVKNWSNY